MKKQTLCLLLCAIILSTSFNGCAKNEDPPQNNNANQTTNNETELEETEPSGLPEMDFDGYTFRILAFQDWNPSGAGCTLIVPEASNGEQLNDLVYERNLQLESDYNMKFSWTVDNKCEEIITQSVSGNLDEYDMASTMVSYGSRTATKGIYRDLNTVPWIDLTNDCWDQNMRDQLSINRKYYQVCGDYTFAEEESIMLTMYNKPMADSYGIENLYDLARNGGWTIDKMQEYANTVINDANGDGQYDYTSDVFGFLYVNNSSLHPYLGASNARFVVKDENDIPVYNTDLSKVESTFTKMHGLFGATGMALDWGYLPNTVSTMITMIQNEQVLFQNMIASFLRRNYRDVETNFGILPMPKFDEAQDEYSTIYNSAALMVGFVPITVNNIETVGFILEAMSEASYELTDTYFNVCLSSKYTRDKESFEMINLAMENIVLDIGVIFDFGTINTTLTKAVIDGTPFASTFESLKPVAASELDNFINGHN